MKTILTPPDDCEKLTDKALYEWSCEGCHLDEVHHWATKDNERMRERIEYLLDVTEPVAGLGDLNCFEVRQWRSLARMVLNCLDGGSVPRNIEP